MLRTRRDAFTLVELLVVISIIGMLMALLFPAVQAARETGRGNTCRNNLRNLALAAYQFENRRGFYPGSTLFMKPTSAADNSFEYYQRPLFYTLFPDLERNDLYELYSTDNLRADMGSQPNLPRLDLLVCPSNPQTVGPVCAYGHTVPYWGDSNGSFWQILQFAGLNFYAFDKGPDTRQNNGTSAFVAAHDGAATTVLFAENLDRSGWQYSIGYRVGWNQYWGTLITVGDHTPANQLNYYKINALNKGTLYNVWPPAATGWQAMRPSSNHPQSVNMAFADTHARVIRETIAYRVYAHLITPWGADQRRWVNAGYSWANYVNLWNNALSESEF